MNSDIYIDEHGNRQSRGIKLFGQILSENEAFFKNVHLKASIECAYCERVDEVEVEKRENNWRYAESEIKKIGWKIGVEYVVDNDSPMCCPDCKP